jgi:hypothetical protein
MGCFRKGALRNCGRLIGLAAAYALLLNVILSGILSAQTASSTAHANGFELCLSTIDETAPPDQPPAQHTATFHCVLCATSVAMAALPMQSMVLPAVAVAAARIAAFDASHSPDLILLESKSPRGPPQQA